MVPQKSILSMGKQVDSLEEALRHKELVWIKVGAMFVSMFSMHSDGRYRAEYIISMFRRQCIHTVTASSWATHPFSSFFFPISCLSATDTMPIINSVRGPGTITQVPVIYDTGSRINS